jgi:hypothetical protein
MKLLKTTYRVISMTGMIGLQMLTVYLSQPIYAPSEEDIALFRSKKNLANLFVSNIF